MVDVLSWLGLSHDRQQLLQYKDLVLIDWECYLPSGFQAIVTSGILEGTVFARATRH